MSLFVPLIQTSGGHYNWVKFVIGLPGSGKTHYIHNVLSSKHTPDFIIDDPTDLVEIERMIELGTKQPVTIIISDPWLCNPKIRNDAYTKFEDLGNWGHSSYFFENDQEKCKRNIAYRNDGRVVENLDVFKYEIPEYIYTMSIWTPPD